MASYRTLYITWLLLLQVSINLANKEEKVQDDDKKPGRVGHFGPQFKYNLPNSVQPKIITTQANAPGLGYDLESRLKVWLNLLKMKARSNAVFPFPEKSVLVQPNERLSQLIEIIQRNDEAVQKTESLIFNSQAYSTIVHNLLERVERNMGHLTQDDPEKIWNYNMIARFIENMIDVTDNGNNQHMAIQALRILLHSIDKNMERLDQVTTAPEIIFQATNFQAV